MSVNVLSLCVLFYLTGIFLIGYLSSRQVRTVSDFVVAGRRLSSWLAIPTIVATWFGAGSLMGVAGTVYSGDVSEVIADPFGTSLALMIAGLFYASRFRREGLLTVTEVLGKRFGVRTEVSASVLTLPFYIGTLAAQLVALGYVLELFIGMDAQLGMTAGAVVVALYTISGGMWAVSLTDVLQMAFLVVAMALLAPLAWEPVVSSPEFSAILVHEMKGLFPSSLNAIGWLAYVGQILMTGLGAIMGQDLIQRALACRSSSVARSSTLIAGGIYFLLGLTPILLGLAGRDLLPELASPDHVVPRLAMESLSPVWVLIFTVGLVSAIMSTADSYLLAGASILNQNVLAHVRKHISEQERLRGIRVSSLTLVVLAWFLAGSGWSIFQLMVHSGVTLFVSVFVPVTVALYRPHSSKKAVLAAMFGGLLVWLGAVALGGYMDWASGDILLYAAATLGGFGSLFCFWITELTTEKL